MENTLENKKIVWTTVDNIYGESTLKQHAYIEAERRAFYEEKYWGNKALCDKGGVNDGDRFVHIDEIQAEEIHENCCKRCLKIYNSKLKEK